MQEVIIKRALKQQLASVLHLQKRCYQSEAEIYNDFNIQPLTQTLEELEEDFDKGAVFLIAMTQQLIVGSVRASTKDNTCYINKLIVAPGFQDKGLGKLLMQAIENEMAPVNRFELFTGNKSQKNLYLYEQLGYLIYDTKKIHDGLTLVFLEKPIDEKLHIL